MIRIIAAAEHSGEKWMMIEKSEFWTIQRNGGYPLHMGTERYIRRVWRKRFETKGIA